jgi:hypothetical protein
VRLFYLHIPMKDEAMAMRAVFDGKDLIGVKIFDGKTEIFIPKNRILPTIFVMMTELVENDE